MWSAGITSRGGQRAEWLYHAQFLTDTKPIRSDQECSPKIPNLQQRPVRRHRFRPAVAAQHQVLQLEVAIGHALHRAAQRSLAYA